MSGVDHATVDLELAEGIVDLAGGELVTEGHEGVSEGLGVNLAVDFKGFEGLEDGFVVVSAAGHLGGEEGDHLGKVHGSISLIKHALEITHGLKKSWKYFEASALNIVFAKNIDNFSNNQGI